jgi:hypothetical protein
MRCMYGRWRGRSVRDVRWAERVDGTGGSDGVDAQSGVQSTSRMAPGLQKLGKEIHRAGDGLKKCMGCWFEGRPKGAPAVLWEVEVCRGPTCARVCARGQIKGGQWRKRRGSWNVGGKAGGRGGTLSQSCYKVGWIEEAFQGARSAP